ncbi:MAG: shikimate dehydrogenase [Bacteroidales bacterium]|nr:shikimate dehydrogenase [Bacteroidales bacterium]
MVSEEELRIFAVIGSPISYSRSPRIMNAAFRALQLQARYLRMAVTTEEDAVETIHRLGISGCNITAPFKTTIVPFLSELDDRSQELQCVNTVVRKGTDLVGYNTDVNGVFSSLHQYLDQTDDLFVLIVGNGGAARSAIFVAKKMKMNVFLCGRNFSHVQQLADETGCTAIKPERIQQAANVAAVIISTVPQDAELMQSIHFHPFHLLLDSVYPNPALKARVESEGAIYISGNHWLLYQACPSFKIFTNEDAPLSTMAAALKDISQPSCQYVTMIGLSMDRMAAVASLLAPLFHHRVVNLDGVLLPMLALQSLPEDDETTLILCGLDQLVDENLMNFVRDKSFTFWIDEGFTRQNVDLYSKSIPLFASLTDVLVPSFLKSDEEVFVIIKKEISLLFHKN